jgi:hypothetical protein
VITIAAAAAAIIRVFAVTTVKFALGCIAGFVAVAIVDPIAGTIEVASGQRPAHVKFKSFRQSKKIIRINPLHEQHIIIKVDKPLGKALDPMQMRLDSWRAKSGQVTLIEEDLFVSDQAHSARITQIEPNGPLTIGHNKNAPNPRGVLLERAERVLQLVIVLETIGRKSLGKGIARVPHDLGRVNVVHYFMIE